MKCIELIILISIFSITVFAQNTEKLTLSKTIGLAQEKSPHAISAKHTLRSAYWNYRYYKASYKPSLTLNTSPEFNRGIERVVQPDGTYNFVHVSELSNDISLEISQNIPFTGGNLFIKSSLLRDDQIEGEGTTAYRSQPISIGYQQNLIGYNEIKWNSKIEPLRWQEAKKQYNETMELVASQASIYYFELAAAQTDVEIAKSNLASADTLCTFAEGRYNIGTISENEMLQLKLNKLREETNLLDANITLQTVAENLRNFLDLPTNTSLRVDISKLPDSLITSFFDNKPLEISIEQALNYALKNSPELDKYYRNQLESRQNLAYCKANSGLKANLYIQFGLSQTAAELSETYHSPTDMQYASLTLSIPILDWGKGKGSKKVAQSNVDLSDINAEQGIKSFEQNVIKMVQQFNLQSKRVEVAKQVDQTAEKRYEVARQLYLLGKNTILDLNSAISEKDSARRNYISSLSTYWSLYYGLRSITGYDFANNCPINWDIQI
ncbi:MAG: TolC family protein [Bacteroidales bacterium]|nr:TolC family protein [Bacteroidales bacterium]